MQKVPKFSSISGKLHVHTLHIYILYVGHFTTLWETKTCTLHMGHSQILSWESCHILYMYFKFYNNTRLHSQVYENDQIMEKQILYLMVITGKTPQRLTHLLLVFITTVGSEKYYYQIRLIWSIICINLYFLSYSKSRQRFTMMREIWKVHSFYIQNSLRKQRI